MIVKIPEPMTAPMPSDVRLSHPRDFFNRTSAFSQSDRSWSMLLQRKSCDPTHALRSHSGKPEPEATRCTFGESVRASMYPEMTCHATFGRIPLHAHVFSGHACSSCAYRSMNF